MMRVFRHMLVLACAFTLFSTEAPAQGFLRRVPESRGEIVASYAPLVKKTAPAVVNIYAANRVKVRASPFLGDPFFEQFFGGNLRGLTREKIVNSLGSGVIVDPDGLILTNLHVIGEGDRIKVVLSDKREFGAKLALADKQADLALLTIDNDGETLPHLELADSDALEVGDLVLAIGNPFGVGQTVTSGIISALARGNVGVGDYGFFIQTDAAINPGNSGGALVDMAGRLAGINTAIYSKSGGSQGVGFATPANMARVVLSNYRHGAKKIVRPWLGAATQSVTQEIADSLGLKKPGGVLVRGVYPGGAADKAGLRQGDVITAVEDNAVENEGALKFHIGTYPIGRTVTLSIMRGGETLDLAVTMEPPGEVPPRNATLLKGSHPLAGAVAANLSPALADELDVPDTEGVTVMEVKGDSYAAQFVAPKDVIAAVNGVKVTGVKQLLGLLQSPRKSWNVSVRRGGKTLTINVRM